MDQETAYRIVPADSDRIDEIKSFVLTVMSDLYPQGTYYEDPHDLAFFDEVYIQPSNALFLITTDASGQIIGTAAVRPYDRRFPEVEAAFGREPVCEIVKFYIHSDHRKKGIGSRLYAIAEHFAREAGYKMSYLHTSTFLPGGYPFWKSRGYVEYYWESETVVHMSKNFQ
ncbi:GNAT family N-acetyltransferase [Paenibacillus athensensis]|uniref:N-acetyltransferase domain-containing protein n=1 Tax=Paenibacillus athensensis TaxID=1967502 RepID=A0A4Y8QA75_9BACL|nr:GNAT family N-acetyltransferase [Paenibacillus athensensis]MCD1257685.1 GNAT family N-acetyltransferase [Paenibacillus athensensis]